MKSHLNQSLRRALLAVTLLAGCGSTTSEPAVHQLVLVDRESSEIFVASPDQSVPATHPKTGQKTLMAAMYCPRCETWHAVPPLEVLQRSPDAAKCQKTKTPLVADGPVPGNAAVLGAASRQ